MLLESQHCQTRSFSGKLETDEMATDAMQPEVVVSGHMEERKERGAAPQGPARYGYRWKKACRGVGVRTGTW